MHKVSKIMENINLKIYKKVKESENNGLILIDGLTCSGKTSFANDIKKFLNSKKISSTIISKDLFLKSRNYRIKLLKKKKIKKFNQNVQHYERLKFNKLLAAIINQKKQEIKFNNLYNRKSGLNNFKFQFKIKTRHVYIIEGLYILNDLPQTCPAIYKIFLVVDLYKSLSKKFQRIRDKKISLENVIFEFKNIHLKSYLKYLKTNTQFNIIYDCFNNREYRKTMLFKQTDAILQFILKH